MALHVDSMSKERPHGDTAEEQPRRSVQKASVRVTVALSPSDFYAQIGTGKVTAWSMNYVY